MSFTSYVWVAHDEKKENSLGGGDLFGGGSGRRPGDADVTFPAGS